MLWCNDYCFVHYPKTAGKSLTRFFVKAWERPINGFISKGQVKELADCELEKTNIVVGRGHENLVESQQIIKEDGKDIHAMKAIFVCIRNPYDLMVSNYHFMRETYKNNKDKANFIVAHNNDFDTFCEEVGVSSPRNWMELDGKQPANLQVIRFESLNADLIANAEKYGYAAPEIDHLNSSKRGHYSEYMTSRSEKAIYEKFEYFFAQGYYERELFGDESVLQVAQG
ncbi:MAG: sulfotransferase domain-containing protein [Granulosicoccus sp.]|nr:sulfotransferase domain-containing protein [Granulosicoccus sp.]